MLAGDQAAFKHIVDRYRTYIFQIVYGVVRHTKDAEDLTQEVFITIFVSLPKYEMRGFKTWISRIAVNKAIDLKRKQQRRKEHQNQPIDEIDSVHISLMEEDAQANFWDKVKREQIQTKINELPERYRALITMYYLEEKSYEQIADHFDLSKKTVEMRMYRARQWMKKNWKEEDFE